jgi:hypothetical protein
MRMGILGSGLMGGKLGTIFARAGHEVVFSYARTEQKLNRLARETNGRTRAGTPAEAAENADAILLAVHWSRIDDVLNQAGRDNSRARRLSSDGLAYFEAFKFRMLQIEWPSCLVTGTRMRGPEFFRFGPRLEGPLALPHGMRGIERMVFRLWAPEQMKLQETRNTIEIRIASQPYFFKCVL